MNLATRPRIRERQVNIGAISDVHLVRNDPAEIRAMLREINRRADVLCVCGDMTTHGTPEQMRAFCDTLRHVTCPIVAVLSNHDCHWRRCGVSRPCTRRIATRSDADGDSRLQRRLPGDEGLGRAVPDLDGAGGSRHRRTRYIWR